MTKYILYGGNNQQNPDASDLSYFSELTKDLSGPVKILLVYFAREKQDWIKMGQEDSSLFSTHSSGKEFRFLLAEEDKDILEDQIKQADIIYIRGGKTPQLKSVLEKVDNLKELFRNKVIFGSSAGVYVLAKYYYTNSLDTILGGLNILPTKAFCHYDDSKKEKLEKLKNHQEELEVVILPEGKYIIKND